MMEYYSFIAFLDAGLLSIFHTKMCNTNVLKCCSRKLFRRVTVAIPKCCHVPGYCLSATLVTIAVKRKITRVLFLFQIFYFLIKSLNYFFLVNWIFL